MKKDGVFIEIQAHIYRKNDFFYRLNTAAKRLAT
jgi:hypothetical protein